MKLLLITTFIVLVVNVFSQKTAQFLNFNRMPVDATHARFYAIIEKRDTVWNRKEFFVPERYLAMEGNFKDADCKIPDGIFHYYHPNRILSSEGVYKNGKRDGLWLTYFQNGMLSDSTVYMDGNVMGTSLHWHANGFIADSSTIAADGSGVEVSWFDNGAPSAAGLYSAGHKQTGKWQYFHKNGKLSALEVYKSGEPVSASYFNEEGNQVAGMVYPDRESEFPGGQKAWMKYLDKRIYFPPQYRIANSDEATIIVSWTIDEDGNVQQPEVTVPFHPDFDKVLLGAIKKSPKWQPAAAHNRRVKSYKRQPMTFKQ